MKIIKEEIIDETGGVLSMSLDIDTYYVTLKNPSIEFYRVMFATQKKSVANRIFNQIVKVNIV